MAGAIGASGPNIRQTRKCVRYYIRLRALLYLGCVRYLLAGVGCYVACATLGRALVYCNFHKEG